MKHFEKNMIEYDDYVACSCDKCGIFYDDVLDLEEFHHINFVGGFASIFGDGTAVQCDLCQKCLYELIKDYYRVL